MALRDDRVHDDDDGEVLGKVLADEEDIAAVVDTADAASTCCSCDESHGECLILAEEEEAVEEASFLEDGLSFLDTKK